MSNEPKTDKQRETKRQLHQALTSGKARLVLDGAPLAAIAGAVLAVIHLLLAPQSGNLFGTPLALSLETLVLFQLGLGVAWTLWRGGANDHGARRTTPEDEKCRLAPDRSPSPTLPQRGRGQSSFAYFHGKGMAGWGIALALSAIASGAIWAMAASSILQATAAGPVALIPPLLALFLFGLHFAPLGLHLLLFLIALCGGLLLTGVGAAHPPAGQQALLILFAATGTVGVLGLFVVGNRLPRLDAELELLRQERDGLREDSDSNLQRFQGADADRQALEEALANAKQAAQAADVKKNEFLAIMSHEIRTPLNGILPLLEMLGATQLNKEQRQLVNTAHNSSRHLLRIINDILDFSKIEAGKLELEQVEISLKELIESVTGLMGNMAEKRNIRLDYRISPQLPDRLRGDPLRLRQILTNLVSNAVKFTEKGRISVEATPHRTGRRDVDVLFVVRDTGLGMDQETVRRLFSSFTQADASTTRKYGGTGLGLAICKRLVNIMGGQIGVRSRFGKGSIFWFLIPMRRPLGEVPAGRESLTDVRALLAGFNERDAREISGYLSSWGVAFSQAEDVPKTLAAIDSAARLGESWLPDLVIFDQSRLGNACKTLLTELRRSPRLRQTAAVALVGDPADAAAWLELGANDTLTRPLRPAPLQQCLHRLLDVRGEERRESQILADADSITPLLEDDILDPGEQDSQPTAPPPKPEPPRDSLAGSVLLVEDNDVNRAVARRLLERIGIEVDEAIDGVQALDRVEQRGYDLVLMDCRMPNKDGYEATGEIRAWERKQHLGRMPIVAMTANAMAGDREKCIGAGMDDYLVKPVNRDTLFDMMSKWIKPREKRPTIATNPIHPTAEVNDMSDAPIEQSIDMKIINELKEVMEGEFGVLLESYITNIPPLYSQLRNAAVAGDIAGMVNPAHSIKSSSANVGAMKVSEAAKTIEMAARLNDGDTAKKAFQLLNQALPPAIKALTDLARTAK